MSASALVNWQPALQVALMGLAVACGPLAWIALKHRQRGWTTRWRALAVLTVFLTFDLVIFGAFTRLSDSGLGCPDWPGCYGSVSPVGARAAIEAAQQAAPTGPVTHTKAWIEMVHRYLATSVGVLITVLMVSAWTGRRLSMGRSVPVGLPTLAFFWVVLQGAFGMLTVTLKLYPAVVSTHLLLALGLLVILTLQSQSGALQHPIHLPDRQRVRTRRYLVLAALVLLVQIALGAWVSTNYAVLACTDFPRCLGSWWPRMDFHHAYELLRPLGRTPGGHYLPQEALTAIHVTHRLGAVVALTVLGVLAVVLWRGDDASGRARRYARLLAFLITWQFLSGLSNVVLGWPLLAALAHTAGAAMLSILLTLLWVSLRTQRQHLAP